MPRKTKKKAPRKSASNTPHTLQKIASTIVLILSIVSALALIAASYAQYINPLTTPIPALLGLAFPIFALSTITLFLLLLLLRPKYALPSFIALALAFPAIRQYFPINRGNDRLVTNQPGFSILSYNTFYFMDVEPDNESDKIGYNRTIQNIINADADIVVIQEGPINFPLKGKNRFTAEQIAEINKRYPYQDLQSKGKLLSKYPFRTIADTAYTLSAFTTIYEVEIDNRKVTLFNNHLESIGLTPDDTRLYLDLTSKPGSIDQKTEEIKSFTGKFLKAFKHRATQVEYIETMAQKIGGNIIMCGDINDTPNSYAYYRLTKHHRDAFLELGSGAGFTYLANRIWVRIDYLLYKGDMSAQYINVIGKRSSDHYPIYGEFEWK